MTPSEQMEFAARLVILAEVYNEPFSDMRLEGYTQLLADQDINDLNPALEACAKVCAFFPRPIDILDAVTTVRYEREQDTVHHLLAEAPELVRETISEAQWQERWATLKAIAQSVKMKPHDGLEGDRCQCADHKRQREAARHAAR